MSRPVYQPLALQCPHCAAPIEVPDERAQLVVCAACDSRLALTGAARDALVLLGPGKGGNPGYDLELGHEVPWRGASYKVIARLCWTEEGTLDYATRVHVLYHPRRALLFLDEYDGAWSMFWKSHVHPARSVFGLTVADKLDTHDGRTWVLDEEVERTLHHVDGCMPWIAEVGDRVRAWEFRGEADTRLEIERTSGEVEINRGQALDPDRVRRMLGDTVQAQKHGAGAAAAASAVVAILLIAIVGALLNLGLAGWGVAAGNQVLKQNLTASELTDEVLTDPFTLSGQQLVRVDLKAAGLNNSWMAVDLALVAGEDQVVHVSDKDMEYYHGTSGGESWSEGSRDESVLFVSPPAGTYQLLVHAVTGKGETASSTAAEFGLMVAVRDGARPALPGVIGAIVCGVLFGLVLLVMQHRQENE